MSSHFKSFELDLHQHGDQNVSQQIFYRFEEIPQSELNLAEDEMLIPVSHFYKNVHELFGIPFFVKVKQGEPFCQLKTRIQTKLGVPDKEWEKVCVYKRSKNIEFNRLLCVTCK